MFKYLARKIQPYLESDFLREDTNRSNQVFFVGKPSDSHWRYYKVKRSILYSVCNFFENNEDELRKMVRFHIDEVERIKSEVANEHLTPEAAKMLDLDCYIKDKENE